MNEVDWQKMVGVVADVLKGEVDETGVDYA